MKTLNKEDRKKLSKIEKQLSELKNRYQDDRPVMERIKSFEKALDEVELTDDEKHILQIFKDLNAKDAQVTSTFAHFQLCIIARALNEGWTPDWTDSNQYKYYPWMKYTEGVGFSYGDCGDVFTRVRLSARAFALKAENWLNMPVSNFRISTINYSPNT